MKNNQSQGLDTHIGSVADKLTKEDLLVGVESVDDETQQLVDLGLEGESFGLGRHFLKENLEDGRSIA